MIRSQRRAGAFGVRRRNRPRFDPLRRGVVDALDPTALDRLLDRVQVAGLGPGELGPPVDDDDPVLLDERQRVLDRGVACADHDDRLARVLVRVVELVLHQRQLGAGHVQSRRLPWTPIASTTWSAFSALPSLSVIVSAPL